MNSIILIGNGFDLAHGLKTKYKHFINDLWNQKTEAVLKRYNKNKELSECGNVNAQFDYDDDDITIDLSRYSIFKTVNIAYDKKGFIRYKDLLLSIYGEPQQEPVIKNKFLKQITEKEYLHNWVDIEYEYFQALLKCLKGKSEGGIEKLNNEFSSIKKALEQYLTKQTEKCPQRPDMCEKIKEKIRTIIGNTCDKTEVNTNNRSLFLNFNYTHTVNLYINDSLMSLDIDLNDIKDINIHGKLKVLEEAEGQENPMIFGYGDETNEEYKRLENENENMYLENIKSIKYFETGNYQELLEFVDSDEFNVFIMGHSCGISDRTLLKTLFEHDNCKTIKIFYHKEENGDDYSDVVRNISRSFKNKSEMRKRIVPKVNCEPLV